MLKEGIDVNTLGVMESPSANRSYSASPHQSPSSTPVNRSISRVTLQPPTPIVVPPSPSPAVNASSSPIPVRKSSLSRGAGMNLASGGHTSKPAVPSPCSSSQDLGGDAPTTTAASDEAVAERIHTNRRSMYRSPGTSSSPDLATLLKKARERGGSAAPVVGALGRKDKRREERPPPLPGLPHHTSHQGPVSYTMGDSNPSSPNRNRDGMGTFKVCQFHVFSRSSLTFELPIYQAKNSVRAKTSAFFGKMLGQSTVRERSVCHKISISQTAC